MNPISDTEEAPVQSEMVHHAKQGAWSKIGGKALSIAVILHAILLLIGAIWIFQIQYEPEKKVDFMSGNGEAGGAERGVEYKIQQKKQALIAPVSSIKRVFAEGAISSYSMPEPGDSFGELSTLASLGGGGLSGGLGGSGGGKGFGTGAGAGAGGTGMQPVKMFGLQLENSTRLAVVMDVSRSMTKYLPIVTKELDKLSTRGPLVLYFGCGIKSPPSNERLDSRAHPTNGQAFDRFWQLWQGKTSLRLSSAERSKLKYDRNAPMPLAEIHKQMSKRPDTYFIDFNGIKYAQTALLCDELRNADTIYWFADFMDIAEAAEMRDVLYKLKARRQKLYMHATVKGKFFEEVREGLALPSGGKVIIKDVK
jgi:hypothetical protein